MSDSPNRSPRTQNRAYAALAGLAGGTTVVIIIVALLLGLWLDSLFGFRGPFTIGLVILSVPLSLLTMVRIVLAATRQIQPPNTQGNSTTTKED